MCYVGASSYNVSFGIERYHQVTDGIPYSGLKLIITESLFSEYSREGASLKLFRFSRLTNILVNKWLALNKIKMTW